MNRNIVSYLERSALASPGKCAVIDEHGEHTYAALLERAKRAGSALCSRGATHRAVVVAMEKGADALAVMMGALFAGGFYVPVDPSVPAVRLERILARLGDPLVVADATGASADLCTAAGAQTIDPAALLQSDVDEDLLGTARAAFVETDPAYVLFTSGSTGEPKGVVVSHLAVARFIESFTATFGLTADDRFANQAPFDFDVSTKDIYGAFSLGATLVIVPRALFMEPAALVAHLEANRVTVLTWAVAALCIVSAYHALDIADLSSVRRVLFSGEVMPAKHLRDWRSHLPQAVFANLYGPTEVTCNCLYHVLDPQRTYDEGIPLGESFEHCGVHLVDEEGAEVSAPDVEGEIVVSGPSIALGYLRMPEATAKAFVQNPLHDRFPERVYRTGDLAVRSVDGELFFHGRCDNQVKLQGHRIELEEIDLALEKVDGVMRCRCAFDAAKKRLRAFYEGTAQSDELVAYARTQLPVHMRPSSITKVDTMPLTKNGKVDRTALLAMARPAKRRAK